MREIPRRTALRAACSAACAGLAGCSSGGPGDGDTLQATDTGTGTATSTPTATVTDTPASGGAESVVDAPSTGPVGAPSDVARLVLAGVDTGDVGRLADASVGFEDLDGELSPDATLYLPDDGDTLATRMTQADVTARQAYGNFTPDGRYVELTGAEDIPTAEKPAVRDRLNEMSGPTVDAVVIATPTITYRVNFEGSWYGGDGEPKITAIEIDGSWYAGTAITPWYVVTAFVADEAGFTPERVADIRRTVDLPLGAQKTTSG